MTPIEKENFCALMAALFSAPERGMIEDIQRGTVSSLLKGCLKTWGVDANLPALFETEGDPEAFYQELQREYDRLFSGMDGKGVSLVESSYKPWTQDMDCHLPLAHEKGLLMGDAALHLAAIFRQSGVEIPDQFKACPDHLVLEMEFLSALYGEATDREVKHLIQDHLDWVPQLKKDMIQFHPHPLYLSAVEMLDLFLNQERDRLEITKNGKKRLH